MACWQGVMRTVMPFWRAIVAVFIPIILLPLPVISATSEARCGYVILVMAALWMTEAIPLAVTALIPVFAFPLLGVLGTDELCLVYMKETNMMFLGGLTVAIAVEHCNLHKRIALFIILHVGQSPRLLMAGFMICTMFLSMWISNTASTAMMVPIVDAIMRELYGKEIAAINEASANNNKKQDDKSMELREQNAASQPIGETEGGNQVANNVYETIEENDAPKVENNSPKADEGAAEPFSGEAKIMRKALLLGVAYSANIGGTGVITGTSPNLVLMATLTDNIDEDTGLNFGTWMAFNIPGMMICVALAFIWLQFLFIRGSKAINTSREKEANVKKLITRKYRELGPMTFHEMNVLSLFIVLVLLWLFRNPGFVPGWASWFEESYSPAAEIADATPAMLIVFMLFMLPSKLNFWWFRDPNDTGPHRPVPACLTWQVVHEKIPWGVILLLGGGFAMAEAADASGLSEWLGLQLAALDVLPPWLIVFIVSLLTAMLTEVASNTATASILMPVLFELAMNIEVNPIYLMLPAAVCCSYAFMLPVATPPNAIVFAAANIANIEMMQAGVLMNVICVVVVNIMINTLGAAIFDVHNFPLWAERYKNESLSSNTLMNPDSLMMPY